MVPVDHAGLPSGDAMSYGADATELLDVELDGRTELIEPTPSQNAADSGGRHAEFAGDLLARGAALDAGMGPAPSKR